MIIKSIRSSPFSLKLLKKIHTSSPHLHPHIKQNNELLSNCLKSGKTEHAAKLFEQMPDKTVVSYSIMIHGYAKNGFFKESMGLFNRMRVEGLRPSSFTMVGVVLGVIGLLDLKLGQCVHGMIAKSGFEGNVIVSTSMVDLYAKCRNMSDSFKLFESVESPSLVTWNVIVVGCMYNELYEEGFVLFNRFQSVGLVPNSMVILTLVRGCIMLGLRGLCESVHSMVVKLGLGSDLSVSNSLLDMYTSLLDLDAANKFFDAMEYKDVISWTTMIGLLVRLEYGSGALKFYGRMRDEGVIYDAVFIVNLISACSILGDLIRGKQIHAQAVVSGFRSELCVINSLIAMYSKCGDLESSRNMFNLTPNKSLVSWTAMISGCVRNGYPREALNLFLKLRPEENFCLDSVLLKNALIASSEFAALELCQQLHCHAFEAGFCLYVSVLNTLLSAYSKCGKVELAYNIFKEMGNLHNIVSWNAIISGYGINGMGENAIALFQTMKAYGTKPDSTTYQCVLSACSHAGLLNNGLLIFKQMVEEDRVRPSQEQYGCVVDLLARAGCLSEASEFAQKYLGGAGPNIWKALLSGCLLHGNVKLAELASQMIVEQGPAEWDQAVLLSNVYAFTGRFQDAEELRWCMQERGLIKNPGISLISGISDECD